MKKYFLDANFLLRFLFNDVAEQYKVACEYLQKAKSGEIKLILPSLIVAEMVYVLDKKYKFKKEIIVEKIGVIINTPYIEVQDLGAIQQALVKFAQTPLQFADCYLCGKASEEEGEILTFDKDLKKFEK